MFLNSWNSNQGSMKRLSFLSTISIVFLQIEENLLKKYQCTVLKRVSSILRINIEIVLRKDRRFILPWLLFCKFIFPSVMCDVWGVIVVMLQSVCLLVSNTNSPLFWLGPAFKSSNNLTMCSFELKNQHLRHPVRLG